MLDISSMELPTLSQYLNHVCISNKVYNSYKYLLLKTSRHKGDLH